MSFEVAPIPENFDPEKRNEWQIRALVDGEMREVNLVRITSPYLNLSCGLRLPDGFIGPAYDEKTSFIDLLVSEVEGRTVVGLVYKQRNNINLEAKTLCAIGSLVKEGETCCDTMKKKVCELAVKKAKLLHEQTYALNRLYQVLGEAKRGVQCWWMRIPSEWLELAEEKDGVKCFKAKEGYGIGPDTQDIRFFFIPDAISVSKDILVPAAVGLLLVKAATEGIVEIKM